MKILSVDTSATAASVALSEEGKLIGETFINTSLTHSQTLIPMVEQLLNNTKTEISDIDAIAVNAGPGSFTGVRIGVAAVKGLAFANDIPCVSVSTLESMAYNFLSTDCIVHRYTMHCLKLKTELLPDFVMTEHYRLMT